MSSALGPQGPATSRGDSGAIALYIDGISVAQELVDGDCDLRKLGIAGLKFTLDGVDLLNKAGVLGSQPGVTVAIQLLKTAATGVDVTIARINSGDSAGLSPECSPCPDFCTGESSALDATRQCSKIQP